MTSKATVAWQAAQPLTIEAVDLDGPRAGELRVDILSSALRACLSP